MKFVLGMYMCIVHTFYIGSVSTDSASNLFRWKDKTHHIRIYGSHLTGQFRITDEKSFVTLNVSSFLCLKYFYQYQIYEPCIGRIKDEVCLFMVKSAPITHGHKECLFNKQLYYHCEHDLVQQAISHWKYCAE